MQLEQLEQLEDIARRLTGGFTDVLIRGLNRAYANDHSAIFTCLFAINTGQHGFLESALRSFREGDSRVLELIGRTMYESALAVGFIESDGWEINATLKSPERQVRLKPSKRHRAIAYMSATLIDAERATRPDPSNDDADTTLVKAEARKHLIHQATFDAVRKEIGNDYVEVIGKAGYSGLKVDSHAIRLDKLRVLSGIGESVFERWYRFIYKVQSWTVHGLNHLQGLELKGSTLEFVNPSQGQLGMQFYVACLFYVVSWGITIEHSDVGLGAVANQLYESFVKELLEIQTKL